MCPSISKDAWAEWEDQLIVDTVHQIGKVWSKIAQMLPGRTDNAIKNRFNSRMRRNLRQQLKDDGGSLPVP